MPWKCKETLKVLLEWQKILWQTIHRLEILPGKYCLFPLHSRLNLSFFRWSQDGWCSQCLSKIGREWQPSLPPANQSWKESKEMSGIPISDIFCDTRSSNTVSKSTFKIVMKVIDVHWDIFGDFQTMYCVIENNVRHFQYFQILTYGMWGRFLHTW